MHRVVKSWFACEKLRIVYNAVLLIEGLTFLGLVGARYPSHSPTHRGFWPTWRDIVPLGLMANAFYSMRPAEPGRPPCTAWPWATERD